MPRRRQRTATERLPRADQATRATAVAWGPPRGAQVAGSDVSRPKETAVSMKPQAALVRPMNNRLGPDQARGPSPACIHATGEIDSLQGGDTWRPLPEPLAIRS